MKAVELTGGETMTTHDEAACKDREIPCAIHSPSEHHMRTWPMHWRSDTGVMERTCPHGTGHPDPDHMAYVKSLTPEHECVNDRPRSAKSFFPREDMCGYPHQEWQSVHACDGCCRQDAPYVFGALSGS